MDFNEYFRTAEDLKTNKELGFDDSYHIMDTLNAKMKEAILNKPTGYIPDEVCQYVALDGKKVIGTTIFFRNKFIADGVEYGCQSGSTLYVHPDYRKYAIGAYGMINFIKLHPEKNAIANGISNMAQPLYLALKFAFFETPRFILLKKSRSAVETVLKSNGIWTRPISWLADCILCCLRIPTYFINKIKTNGYSVEQVYECPQEIEDIVLADNHRFKELHDKKWFDWSLKYDFSDDSQKKKELFVVKNKSGEIEAFFFNKIKFFEQASHRGFKNVILGTVSEWGIRPNSGLTESVLQILATRHMPKDVDGCEVTSDNELTIKSFKRNLFFHIGSITMAVYIKSVKDNAKKNLKNWRIRIAGNDTMMN